MPRKQDWTPRVVTPEMQAFVFKSNELVSVMGSLLILWEKLERKPANLPFLDMMVKTYPFHLSFDELYGRVMSWNWEMREFMKGRGDPYLRPPGIER